MIIAPTATYAITFLPGGSFLSPLFDMIISRESRKSRKIIHRYRSYVAVRMANASEMMRFRVICEIRVRQKAA